MEINNVQLWFARDKEDNIITIDEVNDNKNTYYCPLCNSEVIPKAIKKNAKVSSHFAHIDKSKCDSESMIHWWFKHKFLSRGDQFTIRADKETKYECEEVLVEQSYCVGDKVYQPDVTVITTTGDTIYFEMAYSNKKLIEEYLDIWVEMKNIVVEVDIKALVSHKAKSFDHKFNALFYNGKCFNVRKNDTYYNTIGEYKEKIYKDGIDKSKKDRLQKLDWFWVDTYKYTKGEVDIEYMVELIDIIIENKEDKEIIIAILSKPRCSNLFDDYLQYKCESMLNYFKFNFETHFPDENKYELNILNEKHYILCCKDKILQFRNLKTNTASEYSAIENTMSENIDLINKSINNHKRELKEKRDLDYAKNNVHLQSAIQKVNKKYKERDCNYSFYDRFVYTRNVNFSYNYQTKLDFRVPEEITYSNNESAIVDYFSGEIDKYINNIIPLKNINLILESISNINEKYSRIFNKITKEYTDKIGKRRYKTYTKQESFRYYIKGKMVAEDVFIFYLERQQVGERLGYGYSCDNVYFIYKKQIYISKNTHFYDIAKMTENPIEVIPLKDCEEWSELNSIFSNIINTQIEKDMSILCSDCKNVFKLTTSEIDFYVKKSFVFPKRCKCCRDKNKGGI